MNLGPCDNHADEMYHGGLIPKGPRCFNRATGVMVYVETLNPWDDTPNTYETAKLCDTCLAYVKKQVGVIKRHRRQTKGESVGKWWPRKVYWYPPEKVTAEHVRALCKSYKRVPKSLREHFDLDRDGNSLPRGISETGQGHC